MTEENDNRNDLMEGIVDRIASIFTEVPPQKDIMKFADDVFAKARVQLEKIAKTAKAAFYEDIFDQRLERLTTLGCPPFILKKLQAKKVDVISRACALNIPDQRDSLIPVIPSHYLTI